MQGLKSTYMVILQIILNRAVTLHVSNMSERSIAKVAFSFHIKAAHGGVQPVEKGKGEVTKVKAAPREISDPQHQ